MENYEILSLIGKGNFGCISKILRKSDNKILVWKEMDYGHMTEKEKQNIVSEVNILRELRHPNIVRYYDRIIDKKNTKIYIIMEYCEGGDISQLIKKYKKTKEFLPEEVIWKIFIQLLLALYECHTHKEGKILHRDIKPSNVFLDSESNVKLGDFGLSRMLSNESIFAYSHVGTPYYMSPEQIEEMKYDDKSDIWSLGCFLYELTTFHPPFDATNQLALALKIKAGKVNPINSNYSKDLSDVIMWMLRVNQNQRPNCEELINCPPIFMRVRERKLKEHYLKVKKIEEGIKVKEKDIEKREKCVFERESLVEEKEKKLKELEEELNKKKKELEEKEESLNKREEDIQNKEKEALENIKKTKSLSKVENNYDLYTPTKELGGLNINIENNDIDFQQFNDNNFNNEYRKTAPNLINNNFTFNDFNVNNNKVMYHQPQNSLNYYMNQNMVNQNNYYHNSNNSPELNNNNYYNGNNNAMNDINNNQNIYQQKIRYEKTSPRNNINNYLIENNTNNYLYDNNNINTNNFVIENYNDKSSRKNTFQNQFMDSTNSNNNNELNNFLHKQNINNNINDYLKNTNNTSISTIPINKNYEKKNSVDSSNNIKNIIKNSVSMTHKIK